MTNELARDFESIVTAHLMDPERRSVYVEGPRDRKFLEWLTRDEINENCIIFEAANIIAPGVKGGNKEKLNLLAAHLDLDKSIKAKVFIDADFDRLLKRKFSKNVVQTDFRDVEGYFLNAECFDKVLCLGAASNKYTVEECLSEVKRVGREIAYIRYLSLIENLKLPFQDTQLIKFVKQKSKKVIFDRAHYLKVLIQKAGLSFSENTRLSARILEISKQLALVEDLQLIHGKDAVGLFSLFLDSRKVESVNEMLRVSTDKSTLLKCNSLKRLRKFMNRNT